MDTTSLSTSLSEIEGRQADVADYSLHGIVGIRLVNAAPADVAAVTRQLGPIRAPLERDPDITIRFVERLRRPPRLTHVGLNDAGFTDAGFFLFRRGARAQIDLSQIGQHVEIVCESGSGGVPLLIPIINLTALSNGFVALHASAFIYRGTGVVVAGWAKGGKTEALLGFMANGAKYIGDEWIYVSPAEKRAYGIPEPIRIWDWHLTHGADYAGLLSRRTRARFRAIKLAASLERATSPKLERVIGTAPLRRAAALLEGQLWVQIPPEEMFGRASCAYSGAFDQLFLVVSHDSPATEVEKAATSDVVPRIAVSTEHERLDFLSNFLKYRFAFPDAVNSVIDSAATIERELISDVLSAVPSHIVRHPFPAQIPTLFRAMEPVVVGG
jgi:hypothetical protein